MIKFFRKIRQKLVLEDRLSRYVLYALGEIVLVVIGILIALQINNWNEGRKISKRERQSLMQLYLESNEVIKAIESDIDVMEEYITASKNSVNDLKQGAITDQDTTQFAKGVMGVTFYPGFNVPRNVYDETNSTGLLREITSDGVRNAIATYYADLSWIESQLDYFRSVTLATGDIYRAGFYAQFDESSPLMKQFDVDIEQLRKDKMFTSMMSKGLRNLIVFQDNRSRLLNSAKLMQEALCQELGKDCPSNTSVND